MEIPEVRYGLFTVLTVDPFDYLDAAKSLGLEGLIGAPLRDEVRRATGVIRAHGGVLLETFASPPLTGLWACPDGAADVRALAAGRELAAAKPVAGLKGPYVGLSHGKMLFQEDGKGITNVTGPAPKRAWELERVAKEHGEALMVDDGIARLGATGEFESIAEGAWVWRGAACD